jgi:fibrillarin-like pre-rRNA processing protein
MKLYGIEGVFEHNGKIFTQNLPCCKGLKVYNEKLIYYNNKEFRSWSPYRSKIAAAILNGLKDLNLKPDSKILYLGAATGTTVSHLSDIVNRGVVYAVESSAIVLRKILELCKNRNNIMPILSDANHPDRYCTIVSKVDLVYQDISQRNQSEIFIKNVSRYMNKNGKGIIMVKARSIDVSITPKKAYEFVANDLNNYGFKVINVLDISHYEKDHAAIVITN